MMDRKIAAALMSLALLAGCGHSPATTFLVIDPAPPAGNAASYSGPPLRVPFLHLPVTVDRPELTRQGFDGTLQVDDFARWSAPLAIMARNTLIQNLTARLPAGAVLPPDATPVTRETRVEPTVLAFGTTSSDATMTVSLRLVSLGAASSPVMLVRLSTPLVDDTAPSRAQAWSRLLGQLGDQIVSKLPPK